VTESWWPADASHPLSAEPIGAVLERQAAMTPERAAVAEWLPEPGHPDGGALRAATYRELLADAQAAARGLLAFAEPGDRVGLWAANSLEWIVIEFAAALAGLVLVPLNPALTAHEASDLVRRSRCIAVLASEEFRGRRLLAEAREMTGTLPDLRAVIALPGWRDELPDDDSVRLPEPGPDSPFLIQYTSGTTGKPKGAVLTQRAALNVGVLTRPLLELGDAAVWCNPMPMHHVGGSVCVLFTVLASGGTMVVTSGFDPGMMLALLERTHATAMGAVPTMIVAMLDHPDFPRRDLSALSVVQIGGSTVAPSLIRRAEDAFGARIINSYGQSEAPSSVQSRPGDSDEAKALTIGRPGLHREARIIDPGSGATVPVGVTGELCIRSPLTMSGHLDDPGQTAATLDAEGWLHTGDLCSMDPAGQITIRGRLREVIIRGGENIYPAEVEDVLLRHPAVADVAVVGAADERWGEQVAAFVRFRPGAHADWDELEGYARASLAGFKVPRLWRDIEDFPTTASGKIQKFRLREMLA
jgi:fatty-acyl-CoA synthase